MSELEIGYLELDQIRPSKSNPKDHDIGAIIESIRRFGFSSPLILDESTGLLVVGHGRVEALEQMKANREPPPDRISVGLNGAWLVPVVRGVEFADAVDAAAYLLADNKLTELGGWDDSELFEILEKLAKTELALEGTGFDLDDLNELSVMLSGDIPEDSNAGSGCDSGRVVVNCDPRDVSDVTKVCRDALEETGIPFEIETKGGV